MSTDITEMQAQLKLAENHLDQLDPQQQQESLQVIDVLQIKFFRLEFRY